MENKEFRENFLRSHELQNSQWKTGIKNWEVDSKIKNHPGRMAQNFRIADVARAYIRVDSIQSTADGENNHAPNSKKTSRSWDLVKIPN